MKLQFSTCKAREERNPCNDDVARSSLDSLTASMRRHKSLSAWKSMPYLLLGCWSAVGRRGLQGTSTIFDGWIPVRRVYWSISGVFYVHSCLCTWLDRRGRVTCIKSVQRANTTDCTLHTFCFLSEREQGTAHCPHRIGLRRTVGYLI